MELFLSSVVDFDDCWILKRLNGVNFPRLETLVLDYGIDYFDCDLQYLSPHPKLKSLRINSRGSIDLSLITDERYPSLTCLILNTDYVDLGRLPAHDVLEKIIFPPNTDYSQLIRWRNTSYPKLNSWGFFWLSS